MSTRPARGFWPMRDLPVVGWLLAARGGVAGAPVPARPALAADPPGAAGGGDALDPRLEPLLHRRAAARGTGPGRPGPAEPAAGAARTLGVLLVVAACQHRALAGHGGRRARRSRWPWCGTALRCWSGCVPRCRPGSAPPCGTTSRPPPCCRSASWSASSSPGCRPSPGTSGCWWRTPRSTCSAGSGSPRSGPW